MKTLKELSEIVKAYYETQVSQDGNNSVKHFEDCPYPCIAIAKIPLYLTSIEINWRDYGFAKLPDFIKMLEGIDIVYKGVPYIYVSETCQSKPNVSVSHKKGEIEEAVTMPKDYEVRNAYRKLPKDDEGWVHIKSLMAEVGWKGRPTVFTSRYHLLFHVGKSGVKVRNICWFDIVDDIYFDPRNSFPSNMDVLRNMALEENWDDNGKRNKLLDNYIRYTYARIKQERKIAISKDQLHACWNTGLVDYRYEPIFCYMTRTNTSNRWMFKAFCIVGEDTGKALNDNITDLPGRAIYFDDTNLLCQPNEDNLSTDRDHIIREHPSRLPQDWLKQFLGEEANWLEEESATEYDKRVSELLYKGSVANSMLDSLLKKSIDEAIKRCHWNYKTAIPYFDPNEGKLGWFLPLSISERKSVNGNDKLQLTPFAALVVTKGKSGRFQGETIYRLSWAYRCARLVCRPDSDWLTPQYKADAKLDTED